MSNFSDMIVAGTKVTPLSEHHINQKTDVELSEIFLSIAPFLDGVQHQLSSQFSAFDSEISPYAKYALSRQGKQLRAALTGLAANCVGSCNDSVTRAAVIVEMVHLATLVHDDIIDKAEVRRGLPTLANKWGNSVAVLTGDCLFAHSLKLAAEFPSSDVCKAVATATRTVCSGEIIQSHRKGQFKLDQSDYLNIIRMKTGELFSLSCELGGSLAGANTSETQALRRYGMALGTAYQIYDDCLDLFGTESESGKSLGTDIVGGKATLPILLLLEQSGPELFNKFEQMVTQWDSDKLNILQGWLSEFNILEQSQSCLNVFLDEAYESLKAINDSNNRNVLEMLPKFLAQQFDKLGVS
jgi:octaprenyl-diphosphate synthase